MTSLVFSVKWAAASAVYVGMIAGVVRMMTMSTGSFSAAGALLIGPFFGGAVALPLAASNLVAALLASSMARESGFAGQFATFAVLSGLFYIGVLMFLNSALRTMGGLHLGGSEGLLQAGFVAATLVLALVMMIAFPDPRLA